MVQDDQPQAEATQPTAAGPSHPITDQDLTCVHPSCASTLIPQGSSYHSSRRGPMHVACSHQSIPL